MASGTSGEKSTQLPSAGGNVSRELVGADPSKAQQIGESSASSSIMELSGVTDFPAKLKSAYPRSYAKLAGIVKASLQTLINAGKVTNAQEAQKLLAENMLYSLTSFSKIAKSFGGRVVGPNEELNGGYSDFSQVPQDAPGLIAIRTNSGSYVIGERAAFAGTKPQKGSSSTSIAQAAKTEGYIAYTHIGDRVPHQGGATPLDKPVKGRVVVTDGKGHVLTEQLARKGHVQIQVSGLQPKDLSGNSKIYFIPLNGGETDQEIQDAINRFLSAGKGATSVINSKTGSNSLLSTEAQGSTAQGSTSGWGAARRGSGTSGSGSSGSGSGLSTSGSGALGK